VSRSALLQMDFSPGSITHLVGSRGWETLLPGVYRSRAHEASRTQTLVAICLYSPTAAISHTTAGQELGLRRMRDPRIHVLLPHGCRLEMPGVEVHRCRQIDPVDVTLERADGVRLTSPPRTLHDAASILDRASLESAIEHALAERMFTVGTLMSTSARLFHPRRPGSVELREALLSRPRWRQAARSDLEVRFRMAIEQHGLPEPLVNQRLTLTDAATLEVDLLWPDVRVAGEIDHPFWHDGTYERHRDRRRDRLLARHGWLPVRFDEQDIELALDRALDDLRTILLARGWRPSLG
jgi:very-short-patch-repair endonuclease